MQDAIALAIENNLGLEIDRYGPLLAQASLERALAGGPVRGVPSASAQVSSVNAGVGVNGSAQSAGLGGGGGGGSGGSSGNAAIQQVGAITPNLDPILQSTTTQAHLTQPQANTVLSQTNALIQSVRTTNTTLQMGLISGGVVQYRNYEQSFKENAPSDLLNPAVGPHMDVSFRHSLLQGFGVSLNDRGIRIAKLNTGGSLESFRSQLLDLVANVLNGYWDLVSAGDEYRARQRSQENTQRFFEDTQKEIAAGAIPRVELSRAAAEVATRRQDLVVSQANLRLRENALKEMLVRTPDPAVEAAEILPLDRIEIPETDDLPGLRQLVTTSMEKRPDVAVSRLRDVTSEMSLAGTENPLLPSLQVTGQTFNRGVAGTPQVSSGGTPNPYFVGGYGSALGQIFRRNFPNYSGGVSFSVPVRESDCAGRLRDRPIAIPAVAGVGAAGHERHRRGYFGAHERRAAGAGAALGGGEYADATGAVAGGGPGEILVGDRDVQRHHQRPAGIGDGADFRSECAGGLCACAGVARSDARRDAGAE